MCGARVNVIRVAEAEPAHDWDQGERVVLAHVVSTALPVTMQEVSTNGTCRRCMHKPTTASSHCCNRLRRHGTSQRTSLTRRMQPLPTSASRAIRENPNSEPEAKLTLTSLAASASAGVRNASSTARHASVSRRKASARAMTLRSLSASVRFSLPRKTSSALAPRIGAGVSLCKHSCSAREWICAVIAGGEMRVRR